jgi:plasmid replication initiation protein
VARKVVSIARLRQLLAEREKELAELEARRKKLGAELKQVEARVAGLTGRAKAAGRARAVVKGRGQPAKGKKSLRQAVGEVLGGTRKALGPKQIAEALPNVGYVSESKSLPVMVGQVLSAGHEFRRVARGKYRLDRRRLSRKVAAKQGKTKPTAGKKSDG